MRYNHREDKKTSITPLKYNDNDLAHKPVNASSGFKSHSLYLYKKNKIVEPVSIEYYSSPTTGTPRLQR